MCPTDRDCKQAQAPDRNLGRLKEAFDVLDRDGDGIIATSDLELFSQKIVASKVISKEDVHSMLALVEGNLDFEQFLRLLHFQPEKDIPAIGIAENHDDFKAMFQVLDINGDGFVCAEDLRSVMSGLGRRLSEKDIQAMLPRQGAGAGSIEGKVAYEEFVKMMTLPSCAKLNGFSFLQPVRSY